MRLRRCKLEFRINFVLFAKCVLSLFLSDLVGWIKALVFYRAMHYIIDVLHI